MQNQLKDIYNLSSLLKPIFGTYSEFKKAYAVNKNNRACKDPIKLRKTLNQVMVRRKRDEIEDIFISYLKAGTIYSEH